MPDYRDRASPRGRTLAPPTACLAAVLLVAACGGEEGPVRGLAFEEVFREEARVALATDTADPVVEVTALAVRPDGGLLVVDGPAGRVRAFGPDGGRGTVFGRPGEGPGELERPSGAAVGPDGSLYVVQRGGPRVTVYGPDGETRSFPLPGHYGYWAAAVGSRLAVGTATRGDRFALLEPAGDTVATFGPRRPDPARYPVGQFVFDDHAAVTEDRILVNTSFSPAIRVHSAGGDSLRSFGAAPPSWSPPEPLSGEGGAVETTADVRKWLRGRTAVAGLAVLGDSLVVVQYGRFAPTPEQDQRLVPTAVDVYRTDGTKVYEELALDAPVLAGGDRLWTLIGEPPGPWTLAAWSPREAPPAP